MQQVQTHTVFTKVTQQLNYKSLYFTAQPEYLSSEFELMSHQLSTDWRN